MEKHKEITQKTKKSNRKIALVLLPFGLFFWFLSALSLVWDDIVFPWLILILGLTCVGFLLIFTGEGVYRLRITAGPLRKGSRMHGTSATHL